MSKTLATPKFDVSAVPREAERLLTWLTDERQRAIVANFREHAMLEVSGRWPEILSPRLTVAHPVYRISEGSQTMVYDGRDAVAGFYRGMTENGMNVLGPLAEKMAVSDWGLAVESVLGQMVPGGQMHIFGETAGNPDAHYLITHRVANVWPYDENALLMGENVYVDRGSREIYKLAPSDVVTPEMAREILAPLLAVIRPDLSAPSRDGVPDRLAGT
jgi:hypothetical protein